MSIILQTSDGETFEVGMDVAKWCGTIRSMLEHLNIEPESTGNIIPVPNIRAETMEKVLEWALHHQNNPKVEDNNKDKDDKNEKMTKNDKNDKDDRDDKNTDNISEWDAEFLKIDQAALFELIMAANYLDIKDLLSASCKTIAKMIKGRKPEDIRKEFNIKNDFKEEDDTSN